jgi:hypothetical protein
MEKKVEPYYVDGVVKIKVNLEVESDSLENAKLEALSDLKMELNNNGYIEVMDDSSDLVSIRCADYVNPSPELLASKASEMLKLLIKIANDKYCSIDINNLNEAERLIHELSPD